MGAWQHLLVGMVMLLGLLGTVLPAIPGPLVVWAAVFWWAMTVQTSTAWWLLVASTGLLLAQQAVQLVLPDRLRRPREVPRGALLLAGCGGIAGFFVIPVVGAVPGFLGGVYGWERARLGSHGAAAASTRTTMRACGWRTLVQLMACLLVAGGWLGLVLWS
ncbi:DUF456 domain-containing protein [Streptomyces sp. ODS28]|uniref:DUF456 domain-containing protein n=1 Tax=Streptomyces sp. ODS28 TaxID=3136688 RepID=UPI0031E69673